jgi:hypothetical protein
LAVVAAIDLLFFGFGLRGCAHNFGGEAALVADVRIVKTAFGATRGVDGVVFATWIWRSPASWLGA